MEKKQEEAIKRLKALNVHPNVIKDFKKGTINVSYAPFGALYWANEEEQSIIKSVEESYGVLVYHALFTPTSFGNLLSLLVVSNYEEEWEYDWENIEHGIVFSYVENLSEPAFSEFGSIGIEQLCGGLVRTA